MRTFAALLLASALPAWAQPAPPSTWVEEPAPGAAPAAPAVPAPVVDAPPAAVPAPAYPPPPQAAPAAPPPQAPTGAPPAARREKTRDRWYIGFGIGGGNGRIATDTQTLTFREMNGDRATDTTFFNLKVGGTLSPSLLLGGDVSGTVSSADSGGVTTDLVVTNVDAVVTWFPHEKGLFLRGGTGISTISYSVHDGSGTRDGSRDGVNLLGGIGYAFWLGSQFNLTLNLDYSRQWYGGSSDLAVTGGKYWAAWMGFDWY